MKKNEKLFKSAATLAAIVAVTSATVVPSIVGVSANFNEDEQTEVTEQETPTNEVAEVEAQSNDEEVTIEDEPAHVDEVTEAVIQDAPSTEVQAHDAPSAQSETQGTVTVRTIDSKNNLLDSYELTGEVGSELQVEAPVRILGYTINNMYIPEGGSVDIFGNVTVYGTYTAQAQTITFVYQEDPAIIFVTLKNSTTGETLSVNEYEGLIGSTPSTDYNQVIADMIAQGYEVESSDYPADSPFKTNITTYSYTIVMKHGLEVTEDTSEVTRTINSVHSKTGETLGTEEQKHTFSRDKVRDKVTNETTYTEWDSASHEFPLVKIPAIYGYNASTSYVNSVQVNADTEDIVEEVTYTPKRIKAEITFKDTTENKDMEVVNLEGDFDTVDTYNSKESIEKYIDLGYELEYSNVPELGVEYNEDVAVMKFNVEMKHGVDVTTETDSVTRTVKYENEDGETFQTETQKVSFEREKSVDRVTKEATYSDWTTDNDNFEEINVGQVVGYTTTETNIPSKGGVKVTDENEVITVKYIANEATAKVIYFDEVTNEEIAVERYEGKFGKEIDFNDALLNEYIGKNYTVISNPTDGNLVFDVDGEDKVITIKLGHKVSEETETHDVNMKVSFVSGDTKLGEDHQVVVFERKTTTDLVTGEVNEGEWTQLTGGFKDVVSPKFDGYKPTVELTNAVDVDVTSADIEITVDYEVDETKDEDVNTPGDKDETPKDEDNSDKEETPKDENDSDKGGTPKNDANVNDKGDNADKNKPSLDNKVEKKNDDKANGEDPQTGVSTVKGAGVLAMASAAMAGALGLAGFKMKRKED